MLFILFLFCFYFVFILLTFWFLIVLIYLVGRNQQFKMQSVIWSVDQPTIIF